MEGFQGFGKTLVVVGGIIVAIGLILIIAEKTDLPFLGKLPGDIYIKRKNVTFYFPVVTCVALSLVLSFVLYLISYCSKR
jgi:predicted phosphohydrolase